MKTCPKCGTQATDADTFCEVDGAKLEGPPVATAPGAGAGPCPSCGLLDADEGDGYCAACGHRLTVQTPAARLPAGASVQGLTVTGGRDVDDVVARADDGYERLIAFGGAEDLDLEEAGLRALVTGEARRFHIPRPLSRGAQGTEAAPFLVLEAPPAGARPLVDVAPTFGLERARAITGDALALGGALESAGLAWSPRTGDLWIGADGQLGVARLRGAVALAEGARLRAKPILEALGGALLPFPLVFASPLLVHAFSPSAARPQEPAWTVDDARAILESFGAPLPGPGGDASRVAELCDPGLKRDHNEDATATASGGAGTDGWTVLVVCDGVSSSTHAEQASAIAARTTRDALAHFARSGDIAHEGAASAMKTAIRAAHVAVCASHIEHGDSAPAGTTLVAALVYKRRLTVGWVGDSRAYWVSPSGSELLTHDHSWVNETVARGEMSEAEAQNAPLAHALTRCLGPLEVGDGKDGRIEEIDPDIRVRPLPGPGHVVLCSDGLWNYFPSAPDVALLVRSAGAGAGAATIARVLVNHALAKGGGDNVSVAVHAFA